jgi:hypothetical protein
MAAPARSLCLGHASLGAFSCFSEATEAVDSHDEGFCQQHARYAQTNLADRMICYGDGCRTLEWAGGEGRWSDPNPGCYRCGGDGIDPACRAGSGEK